jgi:hypothetical protein
LKFSFKSKTINKNLPRQPQDNLGRAPVYSYRSLRDTRTNVPRTQLADKNVSPKRSNLLHMLARNITLVLCALVLLFGLWLKPKPQVTIISAPGTIRRDEADYKAGVQQMWEKRFLNQSKLTIQADKLSIEIEQMFPEIASATVELPLLGQIPNVVITPNNPVLLLVTQKGAFYVDQNGKTMVRSDQVEANELGSIPTIRDDSGIVPEPGKLALPLKQIQSVITILDLCKAAGLELDAVILPPVSNEVDLNVKGDKYTVKLSLDQDPKQGIGALIALRNKFKTDNINPNLYLDLRVPDKAFYK